MRFHFNPKRHTHALMLERRQAAARLRSAQCTWMRHPFREVLPRLCLGSGGPVLGPRVAAAGRRRRPGGAQTGLPLFPASPPVRRDIGEWGQALPSEDTGVQCAILELPPVTERGVGRPHALLPSVIV